MEVTAENSLGNVAKGTCEVSVYEKTDKLSSLVPVQTGNSNYAFRTVSLYAGGAEREFSDGLYTKANGTFSPAFDISGMGYTHFSANAGVDKVIPTTCRGVLMPTRRCESMRTENCSTSKKHRLEGGLFLLCRTASRRRAHAYVGDRRYFGAGRRRLGRLSALSLREGALSQREARSFLFSAFVF